MSARKHTGGAAVGSNLVPPKGRHLAVAASVRNLRLSAGMSQATVAKACHIGGPAVANWEAGFAVPSPVSAVAFARAVRLAPDVRDTFLELVAWSAFRARFDLFIAEDPRYFAWAQRALQPKPNGLAPIPPKPPRPPANTPRS